jgi:hypothetical protein
MHPFRIALAVLLSLSLAAAQTNSGLQIQVLEGAAQEAPAGVASARRFAVEVTRGGAPAAGATVTFRLPDTAVSGRFASGFRSELVLSDAQGVASVYGIRWGDAPGTGEMLVTATAGGERAEISIPFHVSATAKLTREDRVSREKVRGPGGARKWVILAGIAGGALAGLAFAGGSKSAAPAAIMQPAIVTPSVGTPTITIGRP